MSNEAETMEAAAEPRGSRMLADARRLAFPRYPGSAGNRRARDLVMERLREAGLDVEQQEFTYDIRPALRAIRGVLLASGLLAGTAGALSLRWPGAGLLVLLAAMAVGGVMLVWSPGAERLYGGEGPTRTWNVVGRRRAARSRMTLILLAHYDSKSQNLTLPFRMGFTLLSILASLAMTLLLLLRVTGVSGGPEWIPAALGGVAAISLFALSTLRNGNESPGGVDNAGSVALLLELGRVLPRRLPPDVELVFLAPSAEEDHMIGAMRWLDAHRADLAGRPVLALNFDGAGAPGRPVAMESYGFYHRFAPRIAQVAVAASRRVGVALRRIWLPPAMGIDAIPFHHRGVACLTFASGSLGRATLAVHSSGDVADNLDEGALVQVARLAVEVAVELAETTEGAGPDGGSIKTSSSARA